MIKFLSVSFSLILIISNFAFSQSVGKKEDSGKLTISTEKSVWTRNEPAAVKILIENPSDKATNVYANLNFVLSKVMSDGNLGNGFNSPISLMKTYEENANSCQNDLTKERRTPTGGILTDFTTFTLEKGAKREFSFDLSKMCWKSIDSSIYANKNLFTLVKPGKYKLYISLQKDSNEIEIEIK